MSYKKTKYYFYFILEIVLYFSGISWVFYIDWRYGIATTMMILGDNLKTVRMMKNHDQEILDHAKDFDKLEETQKNIIRSYLDKILNRELK